DDEQHLVDVQIDREHADADQHDDGRIEDAIGHLDEPDPDVDQRQVEHHEDDVADPEAGDETPEYVGMAGDEVRPRRDPMDEQRTEDQRHGRAAGNAERQRGDEGGDAGGVV